MSGPETTREDDAETEHQVWLDSLPEWYRDEIDHEVRTADRVREAAEEFVAALSECPSLWKSGDGCGGAVMGDLQARLAAAGFRLKSPPPTKRTSAVSNKKRWDVYERDGFACVACGVQKNLSVDHIVPRDSGGSEEMDNLQTLCKPCNTSKGVKPMAEWMASR